MLPMITLFGQVSSSLYPMQISMSGELEFSRLGKSEKLRQQDTVASIVGVFINTNAFREDFLQYWNFQEQRLITPSSSTTTIVHATTEVLKKIYRQGYHYK